MEEKKSLKERLLSWPFIVAAIVIVLLVAINLWDGFSYLLRGEDRPPEIEFTWTPAGRVKLKEVVGTVTIEDDYAIDFSTIDLEIVELRQSIKISRDDLVGKSYSERVSFVMLSGNAELESRGEMTVKVSAADDRGQLTEIERVVKVSPEILTTDRQTLQAN